MTAPAVVFLAAFVVGLAPSIIDRALTNRRKRQARAALVAGSAWLDAMVQDALEEWEDAPAAGDDFIYQQMCFRRWEQEMSGGAS